MGQSWTQWERELGLTEILVITIVQVMGIDVLHMKPGIFEAIWLLCLALFEKVKYILEVCKFIVVKIWKVFWTKSGMSYSSLVIITEQTRKENYLSALHAFINYCSWLRNDCHYNSIDNKQNAIQASSTIILEPAWKNLTNMANMAKFHC